MARKKKKSLMFKIIMGIFLYPIKAISFLVKKIVIHYKKKKSGTKGKKKISAQYDPLEEVEIKEGSIIKFENKIYRKKSTIGLILGARGTGKSAIGMRFLENFKARTDKKIYAIGFESDSLPKWIRSVQSVDEIKNNSVVLIDEGGIEFSSRKSMSSANELLSDLLMISRHRDTSVLFITQNSANLEVNAIRQSDYLVLKPSSLLQKDFERKKIRDVYTEVDSDFKRLKKVLGITYIYSDEFRGFCTNSLPSFWSDKVSKGWAHRKKIKKRN